MLITALLYLMVITLLVMSAFGSSILQGQMTQHMYDELQALERAQAALLTAEQSIQGTELMGEGSDHGVNFSFKRLTENKGGIYYQVNATSTFAAAKSQLQSIWLMPDKKRVWWSAI